MKNTFVAALVLLALLIAPAFAGNEKNFTYLALGDSVPFGINPLLLPPYTTHIPQPSDFVGYPETIADREHLLQSKKLANASCPGETSASFLDVNQLDLGCNSPHVVPGLPPFPPFKTSVGLKTPYTVSQMEFATDQLKNNKHINLVTLMIGANDVLLAIQQAGCAPPPAGALCSEAAVIGAIGPYADNLATILTNIRANYKGTLILVGYYAPMSPDFDPIALALNKTMAAVGAHFGARVADAYMPFKAASRPSGDACTAGLVIRLPAGAPTPCDIHPTERGRNILATIVELAQ